MEQSDLDRALAQFEAVETNLHRIEKVASEMAELVPSGAYIDTSSPEKLRHDDLVRSFNQLLSGLPPIDGWSIEEVTLDYPTIGRIRIDLLDLGEPIADVNFQIEIEKPIDQIAEYRHRFNRARAQVVRQRVEELVASIDSLLPPLTTDWEPSSAVVDDARFEQLRAAFSELDRLVGSSVPRQARWKDFSRHLSFGQAGDLHDIAQMDWPSVRREVQRVTFDESEPIPVEVADLSDLVRAQPRGSVTTQLFWSKLDASEFERLVFNLLLDMGDCENVEWLMHTNAPDRGRDVSAHLVVEDGLSGVRRERVIVQCKHWQTKSVAPADISAMLASVSLWEPPPVDLVIIATSGRFSADAVKWIEDHNLARKRPRIEQWPDSRLETLLASRPHLVAAFRLREPPKVTDP